MSYGEASDFGERMRQAYLGLSYQIVELPRESPEKRARFILDRLASETPAG